MQPEELPYLQKLYCFFECHLFDLSHILHNYLWAEYSLNWGLLEVRDCVLKIFVSTFIPTMLQNVA